MVEKFENYTDNIPIMDREPRQIEEPDNIDTMREGKEDPDD